MSKFATRISSKYLMDIKQVEIQNRASSTLIKENI